MVQISRNSRTMVGELCGICIIRWNSWEFSAGQVPENIMYNRLTNGVNFTWFMDYGGQTARNLRNSLEFGRNTEFWKILLVNLEANVYG